MSIQLKKLIRPLVPIGAADAMGWGRAKLRDAEESRRREKFNSSRQHVRSTIKSIHGLSSDQSRDLKFLEKEFIPSALMTSCFMSNPSNFHPTSVKGSISGSTRTSLLPILPGSATTRPAPAEFTDQYESVPISYLGIGVLKRRT
jgi:hypothetical protein